MSGLSAQNGTGKTLAFLIPVIEKLLKDKTPVIAALVLVANARAGHAGSGQSTLLRQPNFARALVSALVEGRSSGPFARRALS